uniref:C_GCAxxG_C_C family probable redox protein n=1 Tax=Candidatus Kentrum sp. TUN TaxID=2126343 RepID=A0A451AMK7_9GAMM|nr:MAG: C_GCAxxG_C_C family probable redox protein [Candidatus Kentron sp. TUN]VFK61203.1 MAG: C_GCAxxG_C_C family probable redox protein [Candidatus Kentron sp. TUN]VFK67247.1 MAG: C_GCAxxG_C_C family probable redox protein [Candidatus Kentron sp. TUN]
MQKHEKQALAQEAYRKARQYEIDYGCCPQCVLVTVQETVGLVDDGTIKASHGLAGGGGLMGGGTCGALSGGLMALSAKRGRGREKLNAGPLMSKLNSGRFISNFKKGRELVERFRQEFGGVTCEALQKEFTGHTYDLWDEKEYKAFKKARGDNCEHVTGTVAKWLIEML